MTIFFLFYSFLWLLWKVGWLVWGIFGGVFFWLLCFGGVFFFWFGLFLFLNLPNGWSDRGISKLQKATIHIADIIYLDSLAYCLFRSELERINQISSLQRWCGLICLLCCGLLTCTFNMRIYFRTEVWCH